ncbi:actin-domain-containing protein [Atractiella rhizophila]|nr:actin-domain-containing protein [Atractiella rhizophila]
MAAPHYIRQRTPSTSTLRGAPSLTLRTAASNASLSGRAHPSPAITPASRGRHSLYGVEDRVVLDLGRRAWKVGFGGEARPRGVVLVEESEEGKEETEEEEEEKMKERLRKVFFELLMIDPKARKVIVIEPPLMPMKMKERIARLLFENLQVPSVSFAPTHLLSLITTGSITGLVVDCGHCETTVVPIFSSRPLYPILVTTVVSGRRLTQRLRALLLHFGKFFPNPTNLNQIAMSSFKLKATDLVGVPKEVLTKEVCEDIKSRALFVGEPFNVPSSRESDLASANQEKQKTERLLPTEKLEEDDEEFLAALKERYIANSSAASLSIPIHYPQTALGSTNVLRGTIVVPGWIRERATELLFERGDEDEKSITEAILECLLKASPPFCSVPTDLRIPLANSILVAGGTAMLPGFIPRLRLELISALDSASVSSSSAGEEQTLDPFERPSTPSSTSSTSFRRKRKREALEVYRKRSKFTPLSSLAGKNIIAVVNDPSPPPLAVDEAPTPMPTSPMHSRHGSLATPRHHSQPLPPKDTKSYTLPLPKVPYAANAGKAPHFTPSLLPWIGGSLAGILKTGGEEILRERWDMGVPVEGEEEDEVQEDQVLPSDKPKERRKLDLPDWTRKDPTSGSA